MDESGVGRYTAAGIIQKDKVSVFRFQDTRCALLCHQHPGSRSEYPGASDQRQ